MRSAPSRLAWLFSAWLLGVYLLEATVAERTVPTLLLIYFVLPQCWLLPAVPLLAWSAWRRDRPALLASGAALGLLGFQLPYTSKVSPTLRLMTYNIARGEGGAAAIAATVSAQRPDVVCLQETNTLEAGLMDDLLARLPDYTALRVREVAILTRFPVLTHHRTALPGTSRELLSAVLDVRGRPLSVLNAHFTTIPLRGGWRAARSSRAVQLQSLLQAAQALPASLAICGDFNTPPRGEVYAALKQRFGNAFEQAGTGFGYTFPAGFPLVWIDHVWLRGAAAVRAVVPSSRASDHRPLAVDLSYGRALPAGTSGKGLDVPRLQQTPSLFLPLGLGQDGQRR
ncbi:endonuclease/exonuclease/phosphatase family protein [Deinococcus sp.]|uniref:endonuclease/exonuclease/phosphatase family protein n=1 Tax=Deinococcus sp. TaxID=47478 RepID=UPI003CC6C028